MILPVRWETHTAPEFNIRPQEAINQRIVDDCDMVVGIFWTRLGSPTGIADSGTLEEIERVAKAGKPVMLYFSHVPKDPNELTLDQIRQLREFRDRIKNNALIETFKSALDFRDKFASQLELKIRDLQRSDESDKPLPLEMYFLSADFKSIGGKKIVAEMTIPNVSKAEFESVDQELQSPFKELFQAAKSSAATLPIVLAVKNVGASGIRNLFVELKLQSTDASMLVSLSNPTAIGSLDFDFSSLFSSKTLFKYRRPDVTHYLGQQGLRREDTQWVYSFDWDAIQPERVRTVDPMYFQAYNSCDVNIIAKVYADNFPSPIELQASLIIETKSVQLDSKNLIEQARELLSSKAEVSKRREELGASTAVVTNDPSPSSENSKI